MPFSFGTRLDQVDEIAPSTHTGTTSTLLIPQSTTEGACQGSGYALSLEPNTSYTIKLIDLIELKEATSDTRAFGFKINSQSRSADVSSRKTLCGLRYTADHSDVGSSKPFEDTRYLFATVPDKIDVCQRYKFLCREAKGVVIDTDEEGGVKSWTAITREEEAEDAGDGEATES